MKKTMLVLLFFSTLNIVRGQLSGVYVADFKDKVEYYLRFFNDRQYYMDIVVHETSDILDVRTMSIGQYSVKGKEISLKDKIYNFQMELVIINDSLKMEKSFCFLKDKTFNFKSTYVDKLPFNWLKDYDSVSIEKERVEYKIQNPKIYSLAYGDYFSVKCIQCALRYCLTINEDNTYRIYFRDLLISEGFWEREGVELILNDTSLKQRFYMMIGNRVLISKLLPGDYESVILKRSPAIRKN